MVGNEMEVPEAKILFCKQSTIDGSFNKSSPKNEEDTRTKPVVEVKILKTTDHWPENL